jgi:molecular chaperone GrpE
MPRGFAEDESERENAMNPTEDFDEPEATETDQPSEGGVVDTNEFLKLQSERNDLFNKLARAQAEFQNARRRLESDKEQAVQFANSSLIKALLPVIDNFERALAVDPAKSDSASLLKGMQIVHDQWLSVLSQQSVQPITPAAGDAFDPNSMQAILQQPSDKYPEDHVTQLLQKGYSMNGRVLRPAQVAVSKKA